MSSYCRFTFAFLVASILCCITTFQAVAQADDAQVQVGAQLIGPLKKTVIIGGAARTKLAIRLNTDVIDYATLKAGDLLDAQLQMELYKSNLEQLDVIAQGTFSGKTVVDLASIPELQSIELTDGQSLNILVWRSHWHWNGGGTLENFQIKRLSDSKTFQMPDLSIEPVQRNDLGLFKLMAMGNRDKFPVVTQWVDLKPTAKNGQYEYEKSGRQMRINYGKGNLNFFTNGRANFKAEYDYAPALVIEPDEPVTVGLSGKLDMWSGKPNDKPTMTWAVTRYAPSGKASSTAMLQFHRALRPILDGQTSQLSGQFQPGVDYDEKPLLSVPFTKKIDIESFKSVIEPYLKGQWENHGLVMQLTAKGGMPPAVKIEPKRVDGKITLRVHPKHKVYDYPVKVQPNVYVQTQGNKLTYGGQRLRLWGVAGTVGDTSAPQRLNREGFNAMRLWPKGGQKGKSPYYPKADAIKGVLPDSDNLDRYDRFVAEAKRQGMFIMSPFLINAIQLDDLTDDASFIAGGEDWEDWKKAMKDRKKAKGKRLWYALDERILKANKQHVFNLLNHVNPYTGKRYAEEECIAVWELNNEAKIIKIALEDGFETWPEYFQQKIQNRWNQWLTDRYGSQDSILKAWGKLAEGESLADKSIACAPIFAQRNDYPQARGDDFVHFIVQLVSDYYKDIKEYARAQAPTGVGVNVQPFSFDTQYRPNTPWQFSVTEHADVANFGMYFFSLKSTLANPPSMYVMDSHTLADKPTVIYETNSGRPGQYRVEHAYRTATFASWQDWDAVFWHYYHYKDWEDEQFLTTVLPYQSNSFYWSAVEFEKDPVMISTIGLAGQIFINNQIHAATDPVDYEVGKQGIFSYSKFNGMSTQRAAFERGARITYKPDEDFNTRTVNADPQSLEGRISDAIKAGDQINWDWPNARLIVDTPTTKIYVGKTPPDQGWYRFSDGIAVGQFGTDFAAFAMVSADGKPLTGPNASQRVYVNARYNAENSGFDMDMSILEKPNAGNPFVQARHIRDKGYSPIIETPVPFTVAFPNHIRATFTGYDSVQRQCLERSIDDSRLKHDGMPLFTGVLQISSRSQAVDTPQSTPMNQGSDTQNGLVDGSSNATHSNLWHPISVLAWSDGYGQSHRLIRESPMIYTNLTVSETKPRYIQINDAKTLFDLTAEVRLYFDDNAMNQVSIKYTQPPAVTEVLADFNKRFGKPTSSKISADAFAQTRITWQQKIDDEQMSIVLTEDQGVMQIVFDRK